MIKLTIDEMIAKIRETCIERMKYVYSEDMHTEVSNRIDMELAILAESERNVRIVYIYYILNLAAKNAQKGILIFPRGTLSNLLCINLISQFPVVDVFEYKLPIKSALHGNDYSALEINVSDGYFQIANYDALFPDAHYIKLWDWVEGSTENSRIPNIHIVAFSGQHLSDQRDDQTRGEDIYYRQTYSLPDDAIVVKPFHLNWLSCLRNYSSVDDNMMNVLVRRDYQFNYKDLIDSPLFKASSIEVERLHIYKPKTLNELMRLEACAHATPKEGFTFENLLNSSFFTREDIFDACANSGYSDEESFLIADYYGKCKTTPLDIAVPDCITEHVAPFLYMFPRCHIVHYCILFVLVSKYYREACDERSLGGFIGTGF